MKFMNSNGLSISGAAKRVVQGRSLFPGCVREGGLQKNGIYDDAVDERRPR